MATEPVLLSPERIQEIVYRKRRHDLGFATGDEKMCVANAVRLVRDDLPDLLDHITAQAATITRLRGIETAARAIWSDEPAYRDSYFLPVEATEALRRALEANDAE